MTFDNVEFAGPFFLLPLIDGGHLPIHLPFPYGSSRDRWRRAYLLIFVNLIETDSWSLSPSTVFCPL